jgi:solute carrier family 25 phosphate transporter 3
MEMVKVKIQTAEPGTFSTTFLPALAYMRNNPSTKFPFGSIKPLWGRQIPYTMAKFFFFEYVVSLFYTHVFTKPKNEYSKSTQLSVTFASGYIAGVICAVVSQLPDNLVSQMGKPANAGKTFGQIASEQGVKKLMTKGLLTRIIMIGTLTGLQWWIYDKFKTSFGMGTTGGAATIKK